MTADNNFDDLLNAHTPFAPKDEEEAAKRLSSTARHEPGEQTPVAAETPGTEETSGEAASESGGGEPARGTPTAFDDLTEGFRELYAEAQALAAALTGTRDPAGTWSGVDVSATVRVTVDDSQRVTDVRILKRPDAELGAAGFAAAVLEGLSAAQVERLKSWSEGLPEEGGEPARDEAVRLPRLEAGGKEFDVFGVVRYANTLFDEFDQRIAAMEESAKDGSAWPEVAGASANRRVRVVLKGLAVSRVEVDETWFAKTNMNQLAASVNEAFENAYRDAARQEGDKLSRTVESVARDCAELYRLIGFQGI